MLPLCKMYQFVIAQSYSKVSLDGSGCSRIGFHARLRRRTPDCGHYRTGAVVVGLVGPGCQRKMGHGRGGAFVGAGLVWLGRPEKGRVGKGCVGRGRSGGVPDIKKKIEEQAARHSMRRIKTPIKR